MKKIYILMMLVLTFGFSIAQNSGAHSPTIIGNSGVGAAWNNASSASGSDNSYAYVNIPYGTNLSASLNATGFGFSVPSNATITGVVATVERRGSQDYGEVYDTYIGLIKGGTSMGLNHQNWYPWATSDEVITYGTSSDLWNVTLTPTDVNSSNFGVTISCYNNSQDENNTGYVDAITLTIYYTVPPSPAGIAISSDGSTPAASAILELKSTSQGLLLPRLTSAQKTAITSPAEGLLIYDNTSHKPFYYNGSGWYTFTQMSSAPSGGGNGISENESDLISIINDQNKKIRELTKRLELLEKQVNRE